MLKLVDLYWQGAHVGGHNKNSIGIMLFGNKAFTDIQKSRLEELLIQLVRTNPIEKIFGHYQLDKRKTCPNFDVPEFLKAIGLQEFCS